MHYILRVAGLRGRAQPSAHTYEDVDTQVLPSQWHAEGEAWVQSEHCHFVAELPCNTSAQRSSGAVPILPGKAHSMGSDTLQVTHAPTWACEYLAGSMF